MPLNIIQGDITKIQADAIVNAANTTLQMGGGVCGAIFKAAGAEELQAACDRLAPLKTGEAAITPGFALPAKYIIHAAGPIYRDGKHGEAELLRLAYLNSLKLAVENDCGSILFPLISSGIYGYPKAEALSIATAAIRDFINESEINVSLVIFDKSAFTAGSELLDSVASYISAHYAEEVCDTKEVCEPCPKEQVMDFEAFVKADTVRMTAPQRAEKISSSGIAHIREETIDYLIRNLDESFSVTLLRLIEATGKTDAQIYRRANIDRRLFSKIRSNISYAPSKPTVLAFAVALELTLSQTIDLLARAGYTLSHSRKFDVIVEYFIAGGRYDIFQINEVLFSYDQSLLGG